MVAANDDQASLSVELPGIGVGIAVRPMDPALPHGRECDETQRENQERCLNLLIAIQLISPTEIQVRLSGAPKWENVKVFLGTESWLSGLCLGNSNVGEGWRKRRYAGASVLKSSDSEAEAAITLRPLSRRVPTDYPVPAPQFSQLTLRKLVYNSSTKRLERSVPLCTRTRLGPTRRWRSPGLPLIVTFLK